MMTWGDFTFSLDTFAYETLARAVEYPWASQARLQNEPAYQATGKGSQTISLRGVVFTAYRRGGAVQPEILRRFAGRMKPEMLTLGTGEVLGLWCLKSVREEQSVLMKDGAPRKQTLSLEFVKYGE